MDVAEVMSREVVAVRANTPVHDVVRTLFAQDVSGVPVLDDDGRVVGVITEADVLARADAARSASASPALVAAQAMSAPPHLVDPSESVEAAARLMLDRRIKRLPVVNAAGELVGIVTRHDLLWGLAAPGLGATAGSRRSTA